MTPRVKQIVKNWVNVCNEAYPPNSLSNELKQERIHGIKTVIKFCNQLEKDNLIDKLENIYPLTHPISDYRKVPIQFKK